MKKLNLKCVVAVLAFVASVAAAKTITPVTPKQETSGKKCYLIGSAEELYGYAELVYTKYEGTCAKLTADIVVNENVLADSTGKSNVASDGSYSGESSDLIPWTPIKGYDGIVQFEFYGQGFSISGLFFSDNTDEVGFIGRTGGSDATIIDGLKLADSYFNARTYVGAFVGTVPYGLVVIRNSSSDNIVVGKGHVGGFVGSMDYADLVISNSVNNSPVFASVNYVGGFLGDATDGASVSILQSENNGNVVGASDNVAGFIGSTRGDSLNIIESLNTGDVSGDVVVGGFVGENSTATLIDGAVNRGSVQGKTYVGGFIGYDHHSEAKVKGSANEGSVDGVEYVGGIAGFVEEKKFDIDSTTNKGLVTASVDAAGFIGFFDGGRDRDILTIENSVNAANVSADSNLAGFVGEVQFDSRVIFKEDVNDGQIRGIKNVGGFIGVAKAALVSADVCSSDSLVFGTTNIGGYIGYSDYENEFYAKNIFVAAYVQGDSVVGSFVGRTNYGKLYIENSLTVGPVVLMGAPSVGYLVGYLKTYEAKFLQVMYIDIKMRAFGTIDSYITDMEQETGEKILVDSSERLTWDSAFFAHAAIALHDYKSDSTDGSIWGQDVARDSYPRLGKKVVYLPVITELNGGSLEEPFKRYEYLAKTAIPTPTRDQYDFAGWYLDSSFAEESRIDTLSVRMANRYLYLYAKWVESPVVDTIPEDTIPEVVVSNCIAFENGLGHYGENCYNSGLLKMEEGACYTMNPDRSDENPRWINNIATETWWWKKVPCDGVEPPADTSTCIAFENGLGNYGEHCYKSGLLNMEEGACYTMNPDRSSENPQWINNIATETWWWKKVSCDVFPDVGGLKRVVHPSVGEEVTPVEAVKTAKVYDVLGNFLGAETFKGAIADVDLSRYAGKGVMVVRFFEGKKLISSKQVSR